MSGILKQTLIVLLIIAFHLANETVRAGEHLAHLLRASTRRPAPWRRAADATAPDGTSAV